LLAVNIGYIGVFYISLRHYSPDIASYPEARAVAVGKDYYPAVLGIKPYKLRRFLILKYAEAVCHYHSAVHKVAKPRLVIPALNYYCAAVMKHTTHTKFPRAYGLSPLRAAPLGLILRTSFSCRSLTEYRYSSEAFPKTFPYSPEMRSSPQRRGFYTKSRPLPPARF